MKVAKCHRQKRWRRLLMFGPLSLVMGVLSFAILSSASNVAFWGLRHSLPDIVFVCLIIQFLFAIFCLVLRNWREACLSFVFSTMIFFSLIIVELHVGPSIDYVRRKVASATGCSTSQLICLGGRLSRESVIVFKLNKDVKLQETFSEVSLNSSWQILIKDVLKRMEISHGETEMISVLERQSEHDKILAVREVGGWLLVFLGNMI